MARKMESRRCCAACGQRQIARRCSLPLRFTQAVVVLATAAQTLAVRSVHQSLKNLNVEYIDLVLLHRPCQQVAQNCLWNRPELRGCDQPFGTNCFGPAAMNESAATAANVAAPMNAHMNLLVVNGCVEFLTEQCC